MLVHTIIAALCMLCLSTAEKIDHLSFKAPFEETDVSGQRLVGSGWKTSGTTVVNKNFVRLTPDRQSKKGSVWSKRPLGVASFSTVLQFRISGQGKTFFGDGIALWITQSSYHADGIIHGSAEKFVGVGVIFDTFKNTENIAAHRDVTILVNDGSKTYEMMTKDVLGCAAKVRYHAGRDDFSVTDSSRAKIVVEGNRYKHITQYFAGPCFIFQKLISPHSYISYLTCRLHVFIDAANTGEWENCVAVDDLALPQNWASRAYIGLSATTGALADNHDLLSLKTYSDLAVLEHDERVAEATKGQSFVLPDEGTLFDRLNA